MCSASVIRIFHSLAAISRWKIFKADVKAALLKTEEAQRDVYVRPIWSQDFLHYWLLPASTYRLVNANDKFHSQIDQLSIDLQLRLIVVMPQLIYLRNYNTFVLVFIKIVNDFLYTLEMSQVNVVPKKIDETVKLGNFFHATGHMKLYGMSITHLDEFFLNHNERRRKANGNRRIPAFSFMTSSGWFSSQFCRTFCLHVC